MTARRRPLDCMPIFLSIPIKNRSGMPRLNAARNVSGSMDLFLLFMISVNAAREMPSA